MLTTMAAESIPEKKPFVNQHGRYCGKHVNTRICVYRIRSKRQKDYSIRHLSRQTCHCLIAVYNDDQEYI